VPAPHAIAALKSAGCYLLGTATTVPEALALERAGIDAIVAQGFEAGGHRGTFEEPFSAGEIGLFALLPQVVDAVQIPVIAAGGIADGRGIAAAFTLGAAGVQLGTAFVVTPESEADPVFRRALAEPRARNTRLTRVFTGRPARAVVTRFVAELADHEQQTLPYPFQRAYTGQVGKAGLARGTADFHSLFAGQSAAVSRPLPAAKLFETLVAETERALKRS
jgi:nitronate monooxygenase